MIENLTKPQRHSHDIALADRFCGGMIGLPAGDAVGLTLEFTKPGTFAPINDMIGGGPFNLKAGQWTDDTSMALCLGESLVHCKGFNAHDQMDRYLRWYREGYLSSTGRCFDIGTTTSKALRDYEETKNPFSGSIDPHSAGNGSLMRLLPVVLFYFPDLEKIRTFAAESSRTTHGAPECVDACVVFAEFLYRALLGKNKDEIFLTDPPEAQTQKIAAVAAGSFREKTLSEIRGSGYVVESLEAALYCFWKTDSFRDAILMAANLGDDADTTAAICGQLAGCYYGIQDIPETWRTKIHLGNQITALARQLGRFED